MSAGEASKYAYMASYGCSLKRKSCEFFTPPALCRSFLSFCECRRHIGAENHAEKFERDRRIEPTYLAHRKREHRKGMACTSGIRADDTKAASDCEPAEGTPCSKSQAAQACVPRASRISRYHQPHLAARCGPQPRQRRAAPRRRPPLSAALYSSLRRAQPLPPLYP